MVSTLRLVIAERAFDSLLHEAVAAGREETGGLLVGQRHKGTVVVSFAVPAGPRAVRTAVRFQPDTTWQQAVLDLLTHRFPAARYVGEWHKHPVGYGIPSGRDLATAQVIVTSAQYASPHGVFPIVVVEQGRIVIRAFAIARQHRAFREVPIEVVPDTDPRIRDLLVPEPIGKEVKSCSPTPRGC